MLRRIFFVTCRFVETKLVDGRTMVTLRVGGEGRASARSPGGTYPTADTMEGCGFEDNRLSFEDKWLSFEDKSLSSLVGLVFFTVLVESPLTGFHIPTMKAR